jgi:hypothetical protein
MMQDLRCQAEIGRDGDLEHSMVVAGQLDQVLGPDIRIICSGAEVSPREARLN